MSFGGPFGLDFAAIIAFADVYGGNVPFLAELLPDIERLIMWAQHKESAGNE